MSGVEARHFRDSENQEHRIREGHGYYSSMALLNRRGRDGCSR
jgi:hypothetical protein